MPFRSRSSERGAADLVETATALEAKAEIATPSRSSSSDPEFAAAETAAETPTAASDDRRDAPLSERLPGAPLHETVLASCGTLFDWEDVVDWMRDEGKWAASERHAAEGMTLAAEGVAAPSAAQLRAEAQQFRRARRLVAGEDILRWLAHWGISEEEWVDWLDRALRREEAALPSRLTLAADEQATWVEAVCSGDLEESASSLARALGAWAERTGGATPPEVNRFDALRHAADEFSRSPIPHSDVERTISGNAAGWVQVALEWADFGSSDAAREAIATMRDDGMSLAAVAELARAEADEAVVRAEDLDVRTRSVAVSAPIDAPVLVGTSEEPGIVAVVRARRHPSAEDPDDEALAIEYCGEERVQAAVDRWVTWRV